MKRAPVHPVPSEITPDAVVRQRRQLIQGAAAAAALAALPASAQAPHPGKLAALPGVKSTVPGALSMDKPTPYADATSYN
ncbi:MAG: twin-arginine translocation signal domain-containing protein, partial [Rubrivivax sp.]|nr:twin-arginine translocation signal domain-containing protein [Rubrivivax sp.]